MTSSKRTFVAINLVLGPLVPFSYAWSARRWPDQLGRLWGDLPEGWRLPYTANMPLAALGYLAFSWFLWRGWEGLRLGTTTKRSINLAYALVLAPSTVWMPLTSHALATGKALEGVIQLILALIALGSLMLLHAVMKAEPSSWRRALARTGAVFFCLQTVVLDALIWPRFFEVR